MKIQTRKIKALAIIAFAVAIAASAAGCGGGDMLYVDPGSGGTTPTTPAAITAASAISYDTVQLTFSEPVTLEDLAGKVGIVRGDGAAMPIYRMVLRDGGRRVMAYGPYAHLTDFTVSIAGTPAAADLSKAAIPDYSKTETVATDPCALFGDGRHADLVTTGSPMGGSVLAIRGTVLFPAGAGDNLRTIAELDPWIYESAGYNGPYGNINLCNSGGFASLERAFDDMGNPVDSLLLWDSLTPEPVASIVQSTSEQNLLGAKVLKDINADGRPEMAVVEYVSAGGWQASSASLRIFYDVSQLAGDISAAFADVTIPLSVPELNPLQYYAVESGDVNGDGIADFLLIDYDPDTQGYYIRIFFGSPNGISQQEDVRIWAPPASPLLLWAIATGDLNGDEKGDLAVAFGYQGGVQNAIGGQQGGATGGMVYIFFGKENWESDIVASPATADVTIFSPSQNDAFGISIAMTDMDADGIDDLWVGAFTAATNGMVQLFYGREEWDAEISSANADLVLRGVPDSAGFGLALTSFGDLNGDGFDDLIVGSLDINTGELYAYIFGGGRDEEGSRIEEAILTDVDADTIVLFTLFGGGV